MLVIPGYIEKGRFIPDKPALIADRARATLTVEEYAAVTLEENSRAWGEFIATIRNIKDEELTGMPERVQFRTPQEIDRL
jgi:hypothetical protein